jgi:hypothetical protein
MAGTSLGATQEQHLGADGHEPRGQEGTERGRVPRATGGRGLGSAVDVIASAPRS